ncbi:hypothetical protein HAZT_HAZT005419 [Hyalella azteca]|uniref:Laminin N-terminal domain-containing protein n=1 Tax=Hyalella azteca TaxID=294128 RepID=A0A6A0H702_HYAAZ|nr:hypothetical protein HAZT_HAZT005419 [Hyalella azteca]
MMGTSDDLQFDISNMVDAPGEVKGLFPLVVNLASSSTISANSTCGERQAETYCRVSQPGRGREEQCGVCDARSPDPTRRHPVDRATDGTSAWWQSQSLAAGDHLHYVTIDIDLQQVCATRHH